MARTNIKQTYARQRSVLLFSHLTLFLDFSMGPRVEPAVEEGKAAGETNGSTTKLGDERKVCLSNTVRYQGPRTSYLCRCSSRHGIGFDNENQTICHLQMLSNSDSQVFVFAPKGSYS